MPKKTPQRYNPLSMRVPGLFENATKVDCSVFKIAAAPLSMRVVASLASFFGWWEEREGMMVGLPAARHTRTRYKKQRWLLSRTRARSNP